MITSLLHQNLNNNPMLIAFDESGQFSSPTLMNIDSANFQFNNEKNSDIKTVIISYNQNIKKNLDLIVSMRVQENVKQALNYLKVSIKLKSKIEVTMICRIDINY